MRPLLLPLLLLAACADEEVTSIISGTISFEEGALEGEVATRSAWGFDDGSQAILYLSPAGGTTCADAAGLLSAGDPTDPSAWYEAGACNLFLLVAYDGVETTVENDPFSATWALNCTLGEGEWVWEERNDWGWYWSGRYWQGAPRGGELTLSGGGGAPLDLTVEMSDFQGGFIYELDNLDSPGTGTVAGSVSAGWCPDLGNVPIFAR